MRVRRSRAWRDRQGKILVMTVLMTPVLFGAALVSTDTAILVNAEAQLKTAADAAALSGAMVLADETRLRGTTSLTSLMSTARSKVISVASSNQVLNSPTLIADNPKNATSGDVIIGYLSATDYRSPTPATTGSQALFNSVKVVAWRDASHGGQIPTFFGGPLGIGAKNLSVSSTAQAQNFAIKGFQSVGGGNVSLLPIVLDKTTYDAMMNRTTADQYFYCPSPAAVSAGSDGVPESQIYPVGSGNPGNWGTIKIGVSNNSTATLVSQIQYGITPAQIATFPNSKIQLDSTLNPPSITFGGNPGLSAGIQSALTAMIGKTAYVGIYDQSSGNGNNTTYRAVNFAAIRVMAVNFQGNPKYVVIQPALIRDQSVIAGSAQANWTNGGLIKVHLAR